MESDLLLLYKSFFKGFSKIGKKILYKQKYKNVGKKLKFKIQWLSDSVLELVDGKR